MSDTVLVTESLLEKGKSERGGWTRAQTALLGEPWPLAKGWIRRVVGREIPRVDADRFVSLGGCPTANAEQLAAARRLQVARQEAARADSESADEELLRAAVSHLGVIAQRRRLRWAVAKDLFAIGSTSAATLCLRFGFDPDSEIGPTEWEVVERAVCSEDEELTEKRWEEIFPGIEPPEKHER